MTHPLTGRVFLFEDGSRLEIIQVKKIDTERGDYLVTYHTSNGHSLPRKYVLTITEFMEHYRHLFPETPE